MPSRIDAFGSETHFRDHLLPVMGALKRPGDFSGNNPTRPVVVASHGDLKRVRKMGYTKIARMEHGAGQAYVGITHDYSYAGGGDADDVSLFLTPNQYSADRWQARYPAARVEVVGCPKLDTLPRRHFGDSIGIQCDPWSDLLAAIRSRAVTYESGLARVPCVAHAIPAERPSDTAESVQRGIGPRPSTTDNGIYANARPLPPIPPGLVTTLTAAIKSATSECTSDSASSCPGSVTSAELPSDWKPRFDGIRLRITGGSVKPGSHTLLIPVTTSRYASLVMPCTTRKATDPAIPSTEDGPVVAISWHWDCYLVPETVSAFQHYRFVLPDLKNAVNLIGHGHPRAQPTLARRYRRLGIELVPDFRDVCRRADLYITDNSSSLFEFAATGRPVVVLNQPMYRKDVHHGLRFWDAANVGVQVNHPGELVEAVNLALEDAPAQRKARKEALDLVYAYRSGAAVRAAAVLESWA